jgi:hypothetical protein
MSAHLTGPHTLPEEGVSRTARLFSLRGPVESNFTEGLTAPNQVQYSCGETKKPDPSAHRRMSATPSLLISLQTVRDRYRSCALEYSQLEVHLSGARLCERIAADLDAVLAAADESKKERAPEVASGSRPSREPLRLERGSAPKNQRRKEPPAIANRPAKSYDPIADARSIAALRADGGKQ